MNSEPQEEQLQRAIGLRTLALAIVNSIVGAGIFVLPAVVAADLGAAAILAYLVCGVLVFTVGLCFAELGSATRSSGGLYEYTERAFGPFAGFLTNNLYWLGGAVAADAAISNALTSVLSTFFPVLSTGIYRMVFIVLLFAALTWINIRSVRSGILFIQFTALGKLMPLIILVIIGAYFVDPVNLRWIVEPDLSSVGAASLLLFFAFQGMEAPLTNGGEFIDPKRTVPRGLLLGITMVLVLYVGIQLVVQGVLGAELQTHAAAPLGAVAGVAFGAVGVVAIVVVSFISLTGCLAGNVLSVPRMLYAAGRDGVMPKPLARVHSTFRTPHVAIVTYTTIGCVLALTGEFRQLAVLSSATSLLVYLGTVLAMMKLRRTTSPNMNGTFRVPGGYIVPIVALSGIVWLLSSLERTEWIAVTVLVVLLSVLYGLGVLLKRRNGTKLANAAASTDMNVS